MLRRAFRMAAGAAVVAALLGALPVRAAAPASQKPRVQSATNGYGSNWRTMGIAADRREEDDGNMNGALLEFGNWMDSESKYMTLAVLGFLEYRSGGAQDYDFPPVRGDSRLEVHAAVRGQRLLATGFEVVPPELEAAAIVAREHD